MKNILLLLFALIITVILNININSQDMPAGWKEYINLDNGFSVKYPADFTLDETYKITYSGGMTHKNGVFFKPPESFINGTNILDAYFAVEWMPRVNDCFAENFLVIDDYFEREHIDTLNGVLYNVIENTVRNDTEKKQYYEKIYSTEAGIYCFALRYYLITSSAAEHEKAKMDSVFNNMLTAFTIISVNKGYDFKPDWKQYKSKKYAFNIDYPSELMIDETDSSVFNGKFRVNLSFNVPDNIMKGSNLYNSFISVEKLLKDTITSYDYLIRMTYLHNTKYVTENGQKYIVLEGSEGGMSHFYYELIYAADYGKYCYVFRLYYDGVSTGVFEPGVVLQYDELSLLRVFKRMRESFRLK